MCTAGREAWWINLDRHAHQGKGVQACRGSLPGRQVAAHRSSEDCGVPVPLHVRQDHHISHLPQSLRYPSDSNMLGCHAVHSPADASSCKCIVAVTTQVTCLQLRAGESTWHKSFSTAAEEEECT